MYKPIENLNGQVAVITGVNGGFGLAIAKQLALKGARIIGIVRRNLPLAQEHMMQLPNAELNHIAILADVTNGDQLNAACEQITQCDILVTAHGSTKFIPHQNLSALTDNFFEAMLTVNLRSVYSVIRVFLPLIQAAPNGVIITLGSNVSRGGSGSNMAYACAKSGLDSLVKNLSKFILPARIVSVNPGATDTGFMKSAPDNLFDIAAKTTPLGRCCTPDDVAVTVDTYITTLRFVTGISVLVDGGRSV